MLWEHGAAWLLFALLLVGLAAIPLPASTDVPVGPAIEKALVLPPSRLDTHEFDEVWTGKPDW
jgi:hypothetical protein